MRRFGVSLREPKRGSAAQLNLDGAQPNTQGLNRRRA